MDAPAAYDAIVIGAGAAGMMCAAVAGQRGRRVLLIDHAEKLGEKIRISGGGRCNFTNRETPASSYLSSNPHFARSALARYTPADFIALVDAYRIDWHEKHRGQLFCDDSSQSIIDLLVAECDKGAVEWRRPCRVDSVVPATSVQGWQVDAGGERFTTARVVIATGGLPVPKIGASDFGLRLARKHGLAVIDPAPALVPLMVEPAMAAECATLAGVSCEVAIEATHPRYGTGRFVEDLLFTHRGVSGPAVLQASSYWDPSSTLRVDFDAKGTLAAALDDARRAGRQTFGGVLSARLPKRMVEAFGVRGSWPTERRIAELSTSLIQDVTDTLSNWPIVPTATEGWKKAEVMRGGVATDELSQSTFEAKRAPGLHFIGEVIDVTGWLGGYNFQWAWASGFAAGQAV